MVGERGGVCEGGARGDAQLVVLQHAFVVVLVSRCIFIVLVAFYVRTNTCSHKHMFAQTHVHTNPCSHEHTFARTHFCINTYLHKHMFTQTHVCTNTCSHKHMFAKTRQVP